MGRLGGDGSIRHGMSLEGEVKGVQRKTESGGGARMNQRTTVTEGIYIHSNNQC